MAILTQFHKNFEFIQKRFFPLKNPKSLNKSVSIQFCCLFSVLLISSIGIIICMQLYFPDEKLYSLQYIMLTVLVQAQSFQILAYSKLIRFQLKLLTSIAAESLDLNGQESLRKAFLMVFDCAEKINEIFSFALLSTMFWMYLSLLGNLYSSFVCIIIDEYAQLIGRAQSSIFESRILFIDSCRGCCLFNS